MTLNFGSQVPRRADSVIKGGDVTIDLKGRTLNTYDGVMKKAELTMINLNHGILD